MPGIKTVFGTAGFNPGAAFEDVDTIKTVFDEVEKGGCTTLDTAALYGESEALLGKAGAIKRFTIDTKTMGGFASASKDAVLKEAENSKKMLGGNVDVYYIHAPDYNVPFEETLEAINQVYKSGFFKRFGLSNFKAQDVQKVHDICKEKGYVLPTVYQGNYSAVARKQEDELIPTLRKLGMSFYAYSPVAGGFLTKSKQDILDKKGRFDPDSRLGSIYATMYSKPAYLEVLAQWEAIAQAEGCSKAALANRWVKYNSALKPEHGDAIIAGARGMDQLKVTFDELNAGPLSDGTAKKIDEMWELIKDEAPLDNFHK